MLPPASAPVRSCQPPLPWAQMQPLQVLGSGLQYSSMVVSATSTMGTDAASCRPGTGLCTSGHFTAGAGHNQAEQSGLSNCCFTADLITGSWTTHLITWCCAVDRITGCCMADPITAQASCTAQDDFCTDGLDLRSTACDGCTHVQGLTSTVPVQPTESSKHSSAVIIITWCWAVDLMTHHWLLHGRPNNSSG
jgi:hypothetical protein